MCDPVAEIRLCVIIPTYNNGGTIGNVINDVYAICADIIVVDDGCTDNTKELLAECRHPITVVSYKKNRGKGYALVKGFRKARELGYTHAITIDADGQHFASDIPEFISVSSANMNSLIVGNRNITAENMPKGNTFANKFSNFWFRVQTGINLQDTQSGFRLYPLNGLRGLCFITSRYEAELELLVWAAWGGTEIVSVPVKVYYPPAGERVSHFDPFWDFFRISVLNVFLCMGAVIYGWPARLIRGFVKR